MKGRTLSHYKILDEISRGGMGIVYRARDVKLEREVAIKVLPPELVSDEERKRRFVLEARAASKLGHSNIAVIHEIDEADGVTFIAMELIGGIQLSDRLKQGPLPVDEALRLAEEIADGIWHAHDKGIVHRDLKPANVMLTEDGHVKIIDFGLAKLVESASAISDEDDSTAMKGATQAGELLGTVSYMSPEQARGLKVDHRSDIFSFGILLQELLTGESPFRTATAADTISAILNRSAPRLAGQAVGRAHKPLQQILDRLLAKEPDERYQSMHDVGEAVGESRRRLSSGPTSILKRPLVAVAAGVLILAVGGMALWSMARGGQARWARETALPEIERLAEEGEYAAALVLARDAQTYLPDVERLLPEISASISIETTPAGADVYVKEYLNAEGDWTHLGASPVSNVRLPVGFFRWRVVKPGFVTAEAALGVGQRDWLGDIHDGDTVRFTLDEEGSIPVNMVRVPGGVNAPDPVRAISGMGRPEVPEFLIDKYEVTNREFKEFVEAGGYTDRSYWKHDFIKVGRSLSWDEAMAEFRDATGRPGPSTWELGDYPEGRADHPVGGVSWYEAAAYAEFAGKMLPTIHHWFRAAPNPWAPELYQSSRVASYVTRLSNFSLSGVAARESHVGITPFGVYDMAGNVREWCWNDSDRGRFALGAAWSDPVYMFGHINAQTPWDRSPQNGFRCARYVDDETTAELRESAHFERLVHEPETPVSDEIYRAYESMYRYDRNELNADVETIDDSSAYWSRERITFDAAYGEERVISYLFLPKSGAKPFQTVVYFPGSHALRRSSSETIPDMNTIDFLLRSGRAVMYPIYKSTYERSDALNSDIPDKSVLYRDHMLFWGKDFMRSVDYLESRTDIDMEKIVFYGWSWGAEIGPIVVALDERVKLAIFRSGGRVRSDIRLPEADPAHFAPRVHVPVLMLNGRHDFLFPLEKSQIPRLESFGTAREHKRHVIFDTGHALPRNELIKETLGWLDTYFGPTD